MTSSSSSRLDFVLQNLIAKSTLKFCMLATNKASLPPLKKNGLLPWAKKHFWTIVDVEIFKANNHFKATKN
jgi:hypothetical protein